MNAEARTTFEAEHERARIERDPEDTSGPPSDNLRFVRRLPPGSVPLEAAERVHEVARARGRIDVEFANGHRLWFFPPGFFLGGVETPPDAGYLERVEVVSEGYGKVLHRRVSRQRAKFVATALAVWLIPSLLLFILGLVGRLGISRVSVCRVPVTLVPLSCQTRLKP